MKYIRQRYVLFEIISDSDAQIDDKDFMNIIWSVLKNTFGIKSSYQAGLWLVRWDPTKNIGILRMDHLTKYELIATFTLITHINNNKVIIHTRKTTGTVKKALKLSKQYFDCIPPEVK